MTLPTPTIEFSDAVPPGAEIPPVPAPEQSPDGLYCVVCDKPLTYGGRGPRPKYCDDHKKNGPRKSSSARMPASDAMAEQAASMLGLANRLLGMGLLTLGFPVTATAIGDNNGQFEIMAKQALLTDPKLCKKILSAGGTSASVGLALAYAGLGASVGPALMGEVREKRAAKALEEGEDE